MSKRYVCSRCGLPSDTNFERHLMTHRLHPTLQPPIWIDFDWLNNLQRTFEREPLMTKAEDDPDGPIDDPEVL